MHRRAIPQFADRSRFSNCPLRGIGGWGRHLNWATFEGLSEGQAAARGGDGAAELFGGFDPFLDYNFSVAASFLLCPSVGRATPKVREFGDRSPVDLTPLDFCFVLRHPPHSPYRRLLLHSA